MFNDSESSHLKTSIWTNVFDIPISKKANIDIIVVIITDPHDITWEPDIPIKVIILLLNTLFKFYCNTTS